MTLPTLSFRSPAISPASNAGVRAARVRFCDREDAEMFLEWLDVRSAAASIPVTFPLFVCTAADAYSVSTALTCATFGDTALSELPDHVADAIRATTLPAVFGPFVSGAGWEVMFAIGPK